MRLTPPSVSAEVRSRSPECPAPGSDIHELHEPRAYDLPGLVARQGVQAPDRARQLVARELRAAVVEQLLVARLAREDDERGRRLAPTRVGNADDRRLAHR